MEWSIRSAKPTDLDRLEPLVQASMAAVATPWPRASLTSALAQPGARNRVAVAPTPGFGPASMTEPLRGFVLARRVADFLEIDLVGVDPDARRRGIARALLADLLAREARSGPVEARLELAASNDPARALYARLGFMVVGRRTRYYPDGDDALLLSRVIAAGRSLPPR